MRMNDGISLMNDFSYIFFYSIFTFLIVVLHVPLTKEASIVFLKGVTGRTCINGVHTKIASLRFSYINIYFLLKGKKIIIDDVHVIVPNISQLDYTVWIINKKAITLTFCLFGQGASRSVLKKIDK